jgi:hypothetical protein
MHEILADALFKHLSKRHVISVGVEDDNGFRELAQSLRSTVALEAQ